MGKKISTGFVTDKINGIKPNSSLKCHSTNYENMSSRTVEYIVMHYTGNIKDTAKANANYFKGANRKASAHFFVDDSTIYQSVELRDKAWHCGISNGYSYYHDNCRNTNSFGIEMCTSGNYIVSDKTQVNAAYLCAYLCKKIGITAKQVDIYVLRHYDVTHKSCPKQMVKDEDEWVAFKTMVKNILEIGSHKKSTPKVKADKNVKAWQKAAKKDGYKIDTDGIWDKGCENLAKEAVCKNRSPKFDDKNLVKIIQKAVGVKADGKFGDGTEKAVKAYQKKNKLDADGCVGPATWKKILGVK